MAQPPAVVKTSLAEIMDLIIMRTDRRSYEAAVVPPYHQCLFFSRYFTLLVTGKLQTKCEIIMIRSSHCIFIT